MGKLRNIIGKRKNQSDPDNRPGITSEISTFVIFTPTIIEIKAAGKRESILLFLENKHFFEKTSKPKMEAYFISYSMRNSKTVYVSESVLN